MNYRFTAHRILGLYYIMYYTITVWSAAPETSLWGVPGPRVEPGTGDPEAETLTTRPPHLLSPHLISTVKEVHLFWQSREDFHGPALDVFYKNCTVQYSTIQYSAFLLWYCTLYSLYSIIFVPRSFGGHLVCTVILYCTVQRTLLYRAGCQNLNPCCLNRILHVLLCYC